MNAMTEVAVLPPQASPRGEEDGLVEMLGALWRGKWLISLAAVAGCLAGLYLTLAHMDPRYRATATIILDGGPSPVATVTDFLPALTADQTMVNTELEVLRSDSLIESLVMSAGLLEDPAFNPALRPPGHADRLLAQLSGLLGQTAQPASEEDIVSAAIEATRAALVVRPVPDSMVIEVSFETGDAARSAQLSNGLVEIYLDNQLEAKFLATQEATEWLAIKVAELELDLQASESAMNSYAANLEVISAETMDGLTLDLADVRDRIAAREAAVSRGEATARSAAMLSTLRQQEADLSARISRQTEGIVTLEQLQREAAADRQIYEYFLGRLKETSVQEGIQKADARLLSAARVPAEPSAPRPILGGLLAACCATALAAAALILREARSATFRTADDLETATGLQVLGQIPVIPGRKRQSILEHVKSHPASAPAEAFRNLRTGLMMQGAGGKPPQVILSTSSLPSEGKTTHSLALAQNFVGLQKNVLLIEGDVRKRVFTSYFTPAGSTSLRDVLVDRAVLADAVQTAGSYGFDILFGADLPGNPADLFAGPTFRRLIRQARRTYDVIIIDSAPVLLVPDARVLAQHADAVLYTVRWDRTRQKQLAQGLRAFSMVNVPVTGLVLGQIDPRGMRKYGYGKDYGTYGKSGYYAS